MNLHILDLELSFKNGCCNYKLIFFKELVTTLSTANPLSLSYSLLKDALDISSISVSMVYCPYGRDLVAATNLSCQCSRKKVFNKLVNTDNPVLNKVGSCVSFLGRLYIPSQSRLPVPYYSRSHFFSSASQAVLYNSKLNYSSRT